MLSNNRPRPSAHTNVERFCDHMVLQCVNFDAGAHLSRQHTPTQSRSSSVRQIPLHITYALLDAFIEDWFSVS